MKRFLEWAGLRACLVVVLASLSFGSVAPVAAQEAEGYADAFMMLLPDDPGAVELSAVELDWTVTDSDGETVEQGGGTYDLLWEQIYIGQYELGREYTVTVDAGPAFAPGQQFTLAMPNEGTGLLEAELVTAQNAGTPSEGDPEVRTATVTIELSSADPTMADTLPEDASWTVSQDGEVLFTDTFAPEHRDLSEGQTIPVTNPIPYGTYDVTIEAGPAFETYTDSITIDEAEVTLPIALTPVVPDAGDGVGAPIPDYADNQSFRIVVPEGQQIPVGAPYTLVGGLYDNEQGNVPASGVLEFGRLFAGLHALTIDLSEFPQYESYTGSFNLSGIGATHDVVLTPAPSVPPVGNEPDTAEVVLNVTSADPDAASVMPEGATYTIASVDNPNFTLVGEFTGEGLTLPVSVALEQPLAFGDYVVSVDATPDFEAFVDEFTVAPHEGADAPSRVAFDVELVPATDAEPETADVVLILSSADPDAASVMPEGSTYTIASVDNRNFTIVEEFTGEALNLPAAILLDQPLQVGDYVVTIDATPDFETFIGEFTVPARDAAFASGKMGFFAQAADVVPFDIVLVPAQQAAPEPTDPGTPVPTDPVTPAPTEPTPTEAPKATGTPVVTTLPSTGQAPAPVQRANIAPLMTVAALLMASAAGFWMRSRRA